LDVRIILPFKMDASRPSYAIVTSLFFRHPADLTSAQTGRSLFTSLKLPLFAASHKKKMLNECFSNEDCVIFVTYRAQIGPLAIYQSSRFINGQMDMASSRVSPDARSARISNADSLRIQLETLDQIAVVVRKLAGDAHNLHLFSDDCLIDKDTQNLLANLDQPALEEVSDACASLTQLMTSGLAALQASHHRFLTAEALAGHRPHLVALAAATLHREILCDAGKLAHNIRNKAR